MIKRFYITLDATTTAGGKVRSASSIMSIDGVRAALDQDKVWCPQCNSEGYIALDGPRLSSTCKGKQYALHDDLCICRCTPAPRLVAAQTRSAQTIDADWHAAKAGAAGTAAARLNTAESRAATSDGVPLVLLDPDTREPFRHRPYRLQLADKVIEGTTDQNGATRPLTAAERALFVKWQVEGRNVPA
jgi:uncharacterized Zn-binding protein involved in type VI secretion